MSGVERALLLTDVVDSTRLAETLGDAGVAELWARHDHVARELLAAHRGREIDKSDGFLLLFESTEDAATYALAYHAALEALGLAARAGLHHGSVVLRENPAAHVASGAKPLEVEGLAKAIAARVMALAGAGQTLLTAEARDHLHAVAVHDHGFYRLKGVGEPVQICEIGDATRSLTPPADARNAYRVVRDGDFWKPARDVLHDLPREHDSFVGREDDLRALAHLAAESARLITLLGLGGTGKTRLAIRFARTWLGEWPGGAWFCDLVEARSLDGIVAAVGRALDVELGSDPVRQLGQALKARGRALVILDNFEQVARHADETLGAWLNAAPNTCFLVTTREVLGLPGECVLALAPLQRDDAADLFVARAAAARRGGPAAEADRADVLALVDLLDRLPLCIELAAARVRLLSPKEIAQRMGERFQLLASSGTRRDRQATLRGTLDWSWDLLSDGEKSALAQLSVFSGDFTLAAAEAVLDLSQHPEAPWVVDVVQSLVDKSLVVARGDERLDLLVTIQAYAADKLAATGGMAAAEERHARHYGALGSPAGLATIHGSDGRRHRAVLFREVENLRAACRRATQRGACDVAVAALLALREPMIVTGPLVELFALAEGVLAMPGLTSDGRFWAALAAWRAAEILQLGEEMMVLRKTMDSEGSRSSDPQVVASLTLMRGRWAESTADDPARRHYERALAAARDLGNRTVEVAALVNLAAVDMREDALDSADARCATALEVLSGLGHPEFERNAWTVRAEAARARGRLDLARAHLVESLERSRQQGYRRGVASSADELATLDFELGHFGASLEGYAEAQRELGQDGLLVHASRMIGNRGETLVAQGALEAAASSLGEAQRVSQQFRAPDLDAYWRARLAEVAWLRGQDPRPVLEGAPAGVTMPVVRRRFRHAEALAALHHGTPEVARDFLEEIAPALNADDQPSFRAQACAALARAHLALDDVEAAERALALGRAIPQSPYGEAILAAYEVLVAAARGDRDAAQAAVARATALPEVGAPRSEVAQVLAKAAARLERG